ncbi:MAG TPA: radical SAM protein [Candidatus Nanoarchaeia archaeon]|nr:radical SAM protein [Candidatus Nanoarchaeia archaeon]
MKTLERITKENNTIKNVGWTIGNFCDAKCKHCYSWKVRRGKTDLHNGEVDIVVNQLLNLGVKTLNLGGNEPIYTNGPDINKSVLPYMIKKIHSSEIVVGITTYGITATELDRRDPEAFDLVNDWDISLDSPFEAEHDRNRGEGIYAHALKALQLCKDKKVTHSIVTCGMNWNTSNKHLEGLIELAKEYDAEIRINPLKPTDSHHKKLFQTPEEFYKSFHYLIERTETAVLGESLLAALCEYNGGGCPCGTTSMRVHSKTPEGKVPVSPCVYLHDYKVGDLLKEDIFDIVNSEQFQAMRKRNAEIPTECHNLGCEYINSCKGGCAARTYLVNGSIDSADPYCIKKLELEGVKLPKFPSRKPSHKGIRVHENYLCTYIGDPNGK